MKVIPKLLVLLLPTDICISKLAQNLFIDFDAGNELNTESLQKKTEEHCHFTYSMHLLQMWNTLQIQGCIYLVFDFVHLLNKSGVISENINNNSNYSY